MAAAVRRRVEPLWRDEAPPTWAAGRGVVDCTAAGDEHLVRYDDNDARRHNLDEERRLLDAPAETGVVRNARGDLCFALGRCDNTQCVKPSGHAGPCSHLENLGARRSKCQAIAQAAPETPPAAARAAAQTPPTIAAAARVGGPAVYVNRSKEFQRVNFVAMCKRQQLDEGNGGEKLPILYLESAAGDVTRMLASEFDQARLHPCSIDYEEELFRIKKTEFPRIRVESGDIAKVVAKKKRWLAVWFDMTCTWRFADGRWRVDEIPEFARAGCCQVNLSTRGWEATAHAREMEALLYAHGMDEVECHAYVGEGGMKNMVFAKAWATKKTKKRAITKPRRARGARIAG